MCLIFVLFVLLMCLFVFGLFLFCFCLFVFCIRSSFCSVLLFVLFSVLVSFSFSFSFSFLSFFFFFFFKEFIFSCKNEEIFLFPNTTTNILSPFYPATPKSRLSYYCEWVLRTSNDSVLRLDILYFEGPSWLVLHMYPIYLVNNDDVNRYSITFNSTYAPRSITMGRPSVAIHLREETVFVNRIDGQGFSAMVYSLPRVDNGKYHGVNADVSSEFFFFFEVLKDLYIFFFWGGEELGGKPTKNRLILLNF